MGSRARVVIAVEKAQVALARQLHRTTAALSSRRRRVALAHGGRNRKFESFWKPRASSTMPSRARARSVSL